MALLLAQLDRAIELLESYPRRDAQTQAQAVHELRKLIKRLRALLRLLGPQLGRRRCARENVVLRDCGRRLAGARDAEVMVATLDELVRRHTKQLAGKRGVAELRAELEATRDRASAVDDPALRTAVLDQLRGVRTRVARWEPRRGAARGKQARRAREEGLLEIYRHGRHRRRRTQRRPELERMHALRKSVKDLRYVAQALQSTGNSRRLARLSRRAEELGDLLGEEHDLALLQRLVRSRLSGRRRTRKTLLKLIARRRRRLRKRSLARAQRLYRRKPKRFARRLR